MNKTKPVTLKNSLLTFRNTDKIFELQGDPLKMKTNKKYNVALANSQVKKYCMILQGKCTLVKKLWLIKALQISHL